MPKRCSGLNIPVFSLRSKKSLGCGDFLDLIPLIDWVEKCGFKILQILPINDTSMTETEKDGYPYSILSAFALHPIYINLQALAPELEKELLPPLIRELNLPDFDYGRTYYAKKELLKMLFIMRGERDLASKSFQTFFEKNADNLKTYAAFCALRDEHGTSDFRKWGYYKTYSELLVEEVCEKFEVGFYYFVQFHLHNQLKEVVAYAHKKGIRLKGDFPMGMHPNSVEAWRFYEYFRWDQQMGAPPDFYNDQGQNWGFPSYDWEEIKEEGYFFLKTRLKWMEQYFDILRLDHVLGYFRLWEIPKGEKIGLMGNFYPSIGYSLDELKLYGFTDTSLFLFRNKAYHPRIGIQSPKMFQQLSENYFYERQEELWKQSGEEKLTVIQENFPKEICAEDIGVIPYCVEEVLREKKMLNLHVQRMPKSFDLLFEDPADFPETCVCTPSNHDTATLREWWEENPETTKIYYNTILKHEGSPPAKLTQELARQIIVAHLQSKARYAMFLLQDLLAMSDNLKLPHPEHERINDPADPDFPWEWRMHLYVEELNLNPSFAEQIYTLVKEAKR